MAYMLGLYKKTWESHLYRNGGYSTDLVVLILSIHCRATEKRNQ